MEVYHDYFHWRLGQKEEFFSFFTVEENVTEITILFPEFPVITNDKKKISTVWFECGLFVFDCVGKKVVSRLRIDLLLPQDFDLDRRLRNTASKQRAPDTRKKKKLE